MLIHENSEGIGGHPPPPKKNKNKTCSPRCLKNTFLDALKIHFQKIFALSFLHLISNGLNVVNNNSLM